MMAVLLWSALFFWHFWALAQILPLPSARAGKYLSGFPNVTQLPLGLSLLMALGGQCRDTGIHCCHDYHQVGLPARESRNGMEWGLLLLLQVVQSAVSWGYRMKVGLSAGSLLGFPSFVPLD